MAAKRRQYILLGLLLAALAIVVYRSGTDTSTAPGSASNPQGTPAVSGTAAGRTQPPAAGAPEVHVEALEEQRPPPDRVGRNLFRFKPKPPPPPPPDRTPVVATPSGQGALPAVAPPPPITLKCIGVFDRGQGRKIAILTDGVGAPMYAAEGQTVAGRYRILRIGAESIEMAYLDGRGRQTIRISGS